MMVDLFRLKSRTAIILLAGLVVSFPTVTSTFAFMFTADGYMAAFLLATAGVYLTYRFKHGIWPGIVCIGLSMGTYQAYITVAFALILLIGIRDLLLEKQSFKKAFAMDWKYFALVVGGAVFYKVVDSLINAYYGITLTDYQGIGSMGILTLEQYKTAFIKTAKSILQLWCLHNGLGGANKYGLANAAVVGGIMLGTVILIIKNKTYKDVAGVIVTVLAAASAPNRSIRIEFRLSRCRLPHADDDGSVLYICIVTVICGAWKVGEGSGKSVKGSRRPCPCIPRLLQYNQCEHCL